MQYFHLMFGLKNEETLKGMTNNCKYFHAKFGDLFTSIYSNVYCNF